MPSQWYGILAAVFSVGAQFVLFLRWMHRRMRNDEIMRAFVRDIATNHLPHIYDALHKIAPRQGITLDETPLRPHRRTVTTAIRSGGSLDPFFCDEAAGIARGGTAWRRVSRAAKWFPLRSCPRRNRCQNDTFEGSKCDPEEVASAVS